MVLDNGIRSGGEVENVVEIRLLKKKRLRMARGVMLVGYAAPIGRLVHRHW